MDGLCCTLLDYNIACLLLAPMLTGENPEEFFPRFRDCFLSDSRDSIDILTRVGGGNRSYETEPPYEQIGEDDDWNFGENKLYQMPTFIRTWDDDSDPTYGYYEFGVPDEWRADFDAITSGRYNDVSDAYIERMQRCYPEFDVRNLIGKG